MPQGLPQIGAEVPQMAGLPPIGAEVDSNVPHADFHVETIADLPPQTFGRFASTVGDTLLGNVKGMAAAVTPPLAAKALNAAGRVFGLDLGVGDQSTLIKGALQSQFDQYRKAKQAQAEGKTGEMVEHSVAAALPGVGPMGADILDKAREGDYVGAGGLAVGNLALPATLKGAQALLGRAKGVPALPAKAHGELALAVPSTKSAPYALSDLETAKPYLNAQHKASPITTTAALRDAADAAIGEIEGKMGEYAAAFPETQLTPKVTGLISKELSGHARSDFAAKGLAEVESLDLDKPRTLPELEDLRRQLNAENTAVKKRNNYDQYTARQTDPGFAAREIAAREIRDQIYNYYESRGVDGVRELRRDEGAVIKVRNAAERQAMAGERPAAGSSSPSLARKIAASLTQKAATATGATLGGPGGAVMGATIGDELGGMIKGGRVTRDALVNRVFGYPDERMPTYPSVPPRPRIAGELPPAPIVGSPSPDTSFVRSEPATVQIPERLALPPKRSVDVPPVPDTSGRIPATLPENMNRPRRTNVATSEADVDKFSTGEPVAFDFIRNTQKAPRMGARFGQDIEPTGRYMTMGSKNPNLSKGYETGRVEFKNPIVLEWGGQYGEPSNWKAVLSKQFGGKKGAALSNAIRKAGHDGIVTISAVTKSGDKYVSEIVDLAQRSKE